LGKDRLFAQPAQKKEEEGVVSKALSALKGFFKKASQKYEK